MDKPTWERFHNALALAIMAHTGCTFSTQECNQLLEMMDYCQALEWDLQKCAEHLAQVQQENERIQLKIDEMIRTVEDFSL